MIPLQLKLSGFLSYREPVDIDFTSFELACISGHNGAGKSSLLDAITWALFGEARKRGEELIHNACESAEVALTFAYESSRYRIRRSLTRGKTTVLEFQIAAPTAEGSASVWRPLTEATTRATQARIETILRLDYDTFVNASFFLQGKADQFTQQKAGERKRILASILGLEIWETYKTRATEQRREVEASLNILDGRLTEINTELNETAARSERLTALEAQLVQLETVRRAQESALEQARQVNAALENQRKLVETLGAGLERARREQTGLAGRLAARETEAADQAALVTDAAAIESAYRAWEAARADLAHWESSALQFRAAELRRQPFLDSIRSGQARLEQEQQSLLRQAAEMTNLLAGLPALQADLVATERQLAEAEARLAGRVALETQLRDGREQYSALDVENRHLKRVMDELKTRLDQLETIAGPDCPVCGQPLTEQHRATTQESLVAQGRELGDAWRANKSQMDSLAVTLKTVEAELRGLLEGENERVRLATRCASLKERHEAAHQSNVDWQSGGEKRLAEVTHLLTSASFELQARSSLEKLDEELSALGYDRAAHEAARIAEQNGLSAESQLRALEAARAALAPLEREISELRTQMTSQKAELERQEQAYSEVAAAQQAAESRLPDLRSAERDFLALKEQENVLNQQVGMARQLVTVLESRRRQKQQVEAEREVAALEIGNYRKLERAFGKDGVPALLIEQALPQIEEKANELLDRLSNGAMRVSFLTQAGFKDKKRDDLKETLDIQISDGAGARDYELFSGGEAFRVNFAIRLALSEVLAQRTGARLQTLVIDEGFGSQDAEGRQRLVEAINTVSRDFAKILIITHLDELKEAFPNRIDVEKGPRGSSVRVM